MANLNPGNDINAALASQRASSDPQFVAMVQRLQQLQQTQSGLPWNLTPEGSQLAQQIQQRASQLGIQLGTGFWNGGQLLDPSTGRIQFHAGDVDTVAPAMLGAAVGGAALGGAFSGGGAAGGSAATSGAAGGATAAGTDAVGLGPVAAGGGTTAASVPSSIATVGGTGGGIFGALRNMAGPLGNVLSTAAASNAQGRREDAANTARAIAENNAAKTEAAKFNLNLPSVRTNQVSRGEVLNTMQDAPLTGDPRIDKFKGGGLIPSAFGPQSRAAGAELSRQAMSGLMNPQTDRLTPQEIPGTHPSLGENIMGGAGLGLDIFSLLDKYGRNPNGVS